MDDNITFKTIKGLSFGILSTEDIKKISVLEITNVEILDCLGHAATNGLYDLRLGPNDRDDRCQTCGMGDMFCAGHSGHINLPVKVYNPFFFQYLYQLLRGTCFSCHRLSARPVALQLTLLQLQALDYGLVGTVQDLHEIASEHLSNVSAETPAIISKLEKKFKEAVDEAKFNNPNRHPVKSVVECRRDIVKSFVKTYMMGAKGQCSHCGISKKKLVKYNMRLVYRDTAKPVTIESTSGVMAAEPILPNEIVNKELMPEEARKHLLLLWENDQVFLSHFFKTLGQKQTDGSCPIDMFFMDTILVPPSRFRRLNVMKGKKYADQQTLTFNEVLKDCILMKMVMKKIVNMELTASEEDRISKCQGKTLSEKYSYAYQQLQRHVTEIFDSDVNKDKNKTSKGIKQILEKKEGLFRMNMMGKRVNYAARSVISPDPYIMVDEIGIPLVFAKKLTFPEPVTYQNVENLRRAVVNGPNVHPGASIIEMEDGRKVRLAPDSVEKRQALANMLLTPQNSAVKKIGGVKIVHRHIKNGDFVLLNRQPTLHRPSMMAHKARILPGEKTLRLHYSNCKSYNADFDGDEMNCHLPQSYLGQAECYGLASVNHQYLVPKDGTPLGGLIQDHIIAGVLLTKRGRFFPKDQYQQLIFSAMSFFRKRIKLLPPAILKPQRLWSGKQVVSTIIINLIPEGKIPPTVEGKAKVSQKNWKTKPSSEWSAGGAITGESMSESEVIIRHGELLCGVIDKGQVGPTPYSLIHMCYELYGGEVSNTILTALARLFTHYLQYYSGFSLGIEDICVNEKPNKKRRRILRTAKKKGLIATAKAIDVDDPEDPDLEELLTKYKDVHCCRDDFGLKMLDMEMKTVTGALNNQINEVCIPKGLRKKFPYNNLQLMVESGAKGSTVNAMQISCLLGQIELEGRRMPLMLNGSTLPSFRPYDTSPQAGGFVGGRFLTGINPQEYFFHCMAGREGLIDTAVKTSRSGYLQRCLIKHLEGITVQYDHTVRDSDGTVIQFLYGEDGMDPLKMQLLKKNRLHLLGMNYEAAMSEKHVQALKQMVDVDLNKEKKKIKRWKKKHPESSKQRSSLVHSVNYKMGDHKERIRNIYSELNEFSEGDLKMFEKSKQRCPDTINSKYRPDTTFGSVSENMDNLISDYVSKDPHGLLSDEDEEKRKKTISPENFKDLCYYHSMKSLTEPGDTVGLLAAQSIGEPSTQMTLNTFHFAGKGEMNVTLGIPRIREILMTASPNIATPTMDLPFLDQPGIEEKANALKLKLSPVSLKDLLDAVQVKEFLSVSGNMVNTRNYIIKMEFLEHEVYKGHVNTTPSKILYYIEHNFVKRLTEALRKKIRQSSAAKSISVTKESQNIYFKNDGNNGDEDSPPPVSDEPMKADDGDSSAESEGEGDTTSARSKQRHDQEQEYADPEEEEILPESSEDSDTEEIKIKEEIKSDNEESTSHEFLTPKEEVKPTIDKGIRINYVKTLHPWISNYNFDAKREHWCEISLQLPLDNNKIDMKSLLEEEINKANIHSVPNINDAILVENPNAKDGCNLMLKTNGVNFLEIFKYVDILDINKVYSNNIHEIAKIYGIEAAAQTIRKEIVNVFAAYGIQVDPRHLSLISDYMTCSGQYRPCNRIGMEGNASPLQQITFETSKNFLAEAMVMGVQDRLTSPSANIIVGQLPPAGTGCFNLLSVSGHF